MLRTVAHGMLVATLGVLLLDGAGRDTPSRQTPAKQAVEQNRAGVAFMKESLFKDAATAFREAARIDPALNLAHINLGIALYYDQDLEGASQALLEAETRERNNPTILFMMGLVCRRKEENTKAAELFSRVIRIDPKCSAGHYNLGFILARQGKTGEAESALRRALELDPNQTAALYSLGRLFVKAGRAEEGNRMLDRYRSLRAKIPAAAGMGPGSLYGEMGKYAIAREVRD